MTKYRKAIRKRECGRMWWLSMYQHARVMSRSGKDNGGLDYAVTCCACNNGYAERLKEWALLAAFGTRGDKLQYWLVNQARW